MRNQFFKIIFLMCGFVVSSFVNAQSFEQLKIKSKLSNECTEDGTDVFEPKIFKLSSGQVKLNTYSCMTNHEKQQRYYSVYGLQFNTKKTVYLQDKLFEAIGYVGANASQMDIETVVFDNMAERGGDLVLVWVQDLNHIYNLKIPYMASDEGGVGFSIKNNQIYVQKVEALPGADHKFKNKGKPIIFKKVKDKGIVFLSGDLKAFQN